MSKIDYDLKKIRAIAFDVDGVLSPNTVPMGHDGLPRRMTNVKDGFAIRQATLAGLKIAIISGSDTPSVLMRFKSLGVNDIWIQAGLKHEILQEWMDRYSLAPEQVAFVGDDLPDYQAMQLAGLSVCPADAADEIKEIARYISRHNGGYGVARDLIEQVMRAHGQWSPIGVKAFHG